MQAGCFRLNQHFPSLPVTPAEYPYSVFEIIVFFFQYAATHPSSISRSKGPVSRQYKCTLLLADLFLLPTNGSLVLEKEKGIFRIRDSLFKTPTHRRFGNKAMSWSRLFSPTIQACRSGILVSSFHAHALAGRRSHDYIIQGFSKRRPSDKT